MLRIVLTAGLVVVCWVFWPTTVGAHGVAGADAASLQSQSGWMLYLYLGAKHMVTGYDHLLYLAGVLFFLHRLRDVLLYVTVFTLGHSVTLLAGVLLDIQANAHLVDALIGLSVVYKAFENLGGFRALRLAPDPRLAVGVFGLIHGLGLATKLQALTLPAEGLLARMLAFNLGVEVGQLLALSCILLVVSAWRLSGRFDRTARAANWALMTCGFLLTGWQLAGYLLIDSALAPA